MSSTNSSIAATTGLQAAVDSVPSLAGFRPGHEHRVLTLTLDDTVDSSTLTVSQLTLQNQTGAAMQDLSISADSMVSSATSPTCQFH